MNFRKLSIGMLAGVCIVTSGIGAIAVTPAKSSFSDLPDTHWSKSYVDYLVEKGSIVGYTDGTFRPNSQVTYVEFIKMIMGGIGIERKYNDENWYDSYVNYAVANNMLYGLDDWTPTKTNLYKTINRNHVALIVHSVIYREIGLSGFEDLNPETDFLKGEKDPEEVELAKWGISVGDAYYNSLPEKALTRAEASAYIARIFNADLRVVVTEGAAKVYTLPAQTFTASDLTYIKSKPINNMWDSNKYSYATTKEVKLGMAKDEDTSLGLEGIELIYNFPNLNKDGKRLLGSSDYVACNNYALDRMTNKAGVLDRFKSEFKIVSELLKEKGYTNIKADVINSYFRSDEDLMFRVLVNRGETTYMMDVTLGKLPSARILTGYIITQK